MAVVFLSPIVWGSWLVTGCLRMMGSKTYKDREVARSLGPGPRDL